MKQCSKCKVEKESTEFNKCKNTKDNLQRYCRQCQKAYQKATLPKWKEYNKKAYNKNPEKYTTRNKKYYEANKESHHQRMAEWRENNPAYNKEYWQREEVKENHRQYRKQKRKDAQFRVYENIRTRIYQAIQKYRYKKLDSTLTELGCSMEEYFVYLEKQFDEHMSWDNYGTYWEIDHKDAIVHSNNFHYTNTMPLSVTENRIKGAK